MEQSEFSNLYSKYFGKRVYIVKYSNKEGIKITCRNVVGIAIKRVNGKETAFVTSHTGEMMNASDVYTNAEEMEVAARNCLEQHIKFIKELPEA